MARQEAEPLVEALRIDAGMMREQLDEFAAVGTRFRNRPRHQSLPDATTAAMSGNANVFDQAA